MKVLVTGGAGYIGSHTVKELLKEGFEVVTLDNFSTGRREFVSGGKVIAGDLRDRELVRQVLESERPAAIIHFAGLIQVAESYADPQKYYGHNLMTSLNLLEAMRDTGLGKFLFSSSAAVYGNPQQTPIPESHPVHPVNPYGRTKVMIENILSDSGRAYGLNFLSLRYFNAAGADPDGQLGEMHVPETHLIPCLFLFLLGRRPRFELYGTDFQTPDGTAIRDYIHVSDLAKAHVLALKKILSGPCQNFINLGSNKGHSVLEIIGQVEKVTGRKVAFIKKPRREGDVPILLASQEKAGEMLGWTPLRSDIETIIATAWSWHRKHD